MGAGATLEDERVGWEQRPVPCGISDVRRAGWGLQSKGQRAVGAERRQTEAQDRRGRKQFSESQLWGGGCRASQEEREGQRGRGVGGRPTALGTLTGDSPSTRGPSLTRMAPLRPLRSSETLVQVSRATGSLLLVGGGTMSRLWALPACPPRSPSDTAKCPRPHPHAHTRGRT